MQKKLNSIIFNTLIIPKLIKFSYINIVFIFQINHQEENDGVILNLLKEYISKKTEESRITRGILIFPKWANQLITLILNNSKVKKRNIRPLKYQVHKDKFKLEPYISRSTSRTMQNSRKKG